MNFPDISGDVFSQLFGPLGLGADPEFSQQGCFYGSDVSGFSPSTTYIPDFGDTPLPPYTSTGIDGYNTAPVQPSHYYMQNGYGATPTVNSGPTSFDPTLDQIAAGIFNSASADDEGFGSEFFADTSSSEPDNLDGRVKDPKILLSELLKDMKELEAEGFDESASTSPPPSFVPSPDTDGAQHDSGHASPGSAYNGTSGNSSSVDDLGGSFSLTPDMIQGLASTPGLVETFVNGPVINIPQETTPSPESYEIQQPAASRPATPEKSDEDDPSPVLESGRGKAVKFTKGMAEMLDREAPRILGILVQPAGKLCATTQKKLVSMDVKEFNKRMELHKLSDLDVALMKEWRRRGKNKGAAQVARKRKRDEVTDLDSNNEDVRKKKKKLTDEVRQLEEDIDGFKERFRVAKNKAFAKGQYEFVLKTLFELEDFEWFKKTRDEINHLLPIDSPYRKK